MKVSNIEKTISRPGETNGRREGRNNFKSGGGRGLGEENSSDKDNQADPDHEILHEASNAQPRGAGKEW